MADRTVVVDAPEEVHDLATEEQLDQAFQLDRDRSGDREAASRAQKVVMACLQSVEGQQQDRIRRWKRMEEVWHMESLSDRAKDQNVHMGGPFKAVEEYAIKMKSSIFGQAGFVSGLPENIEDKEKAELAARLVEDQMRWEARLPDTALADFRTAAIYGTRVAKCYPRRRVRRVITRDVTAIEWEEKTVYDFGQPKEEEVAWTENVIEDVSVFDFRIPETADGIRDAGWCGDFSYPTKGTVEERVARGVYNEAAVKRLLENLEQSQGKEDGRVNPNIPNTQTNPYRHVGSISEFLGQKPDEGPHIRQFAAFEWWGDFDLEGDGVAVPCVITILLPTTTELTPMVTSSVAGEVVRLCRNPYYCQEKPYLAHRLVERRKQFWSPSLIEICGKTSHYQDELATVGLMGAYWEASPMVEVGSEAGVEIDELDGFLPGKPVPVMEPGNLNFLAPPSRSGIAVRMAEFFEAKGTDVAGLGQANNAPRVAAAGIVAQNQELDQRLLGYIDSYESSFLRDGAALFHAYNQQFMTRERKLKQLGADGAEAPDMTIVRPTDILVGMRFEATVGRKLAQKAFQTQGIINWWDRAAMDTAMGAQLGRPPLFNMENMAKWIFKEAFGATNVGHFVNTMTDVDDLRSTSMEHKVMAMGEVLSPQKGEKTWVHVREHLKFLEDGGTDGWSPSSRQILIDHVMETIDQLYREVEQSMPGTGEIMAQMFGQQLAMAGGASTGERGYMDAQPQQGMGQGGGRGFGSPTQAPGSPLLRRPTMGGPGTQGETMSGANNLGAM